ncbi:uncharacterized protein LOC129146203 [Talpa occidentalis]|uniref:uncharacterized protein LOC129146203 n=1 Tax=Talpa occidentalis TaxID=50954 RepID=UPI0023F7981C|nr:uncharacterized protein LOC129146203 [Talpa occidentalis]
MEVAIKVIPMSGMPQRFLAREVACMKVLRHRTFSSSSSVPGPAEEDDELDPLSGSNLDSVIQHPWVRLTNGLPCREPSQGQHKDTMEAMVRLGFWKEVIDRALLEGRYDPVMGTFLKLLSRQRVDEEGPDPTISPKLLSPDGAHCAPIPEDHWQPEVSGPEKLRVGLSPKQDAQKPTTTSGQGIPQEDASIQSSVSSSGTLMPDAWKPSMASSQGPCCGRHGGPTPHRFQAPCRSKLWAPTLLFQAPTWRGGRKALGRHPAQPPSSPAPPK